VFEEGQRVVLIKEVKSAPFSPLPKLGEQGTVTTVHRAGDRVIGYMVLFPSGGMMTLLPEELEAVIV